MEYCVCSMGCDFLLNLSCCNAKQRTVQTRAKRVCHVNSVAKPGKTPSTVTCFLGDLRALVALTCKTHTFDWSWGDTPVLCTSPWKLEKTRKALGHRVDCLLDSFISHQTQVFRIPKRTLQPATKSLCTTANP